MAQQQQQTEGAAPAEAPQLSERDSILAELSNLSDEGEAPAEGDKPAEDDGEAGEGAAADESDSDGDDESDGSDDPADGDETETDDTPDDGDGEDTTDPELARRLEKIQRQEKRAKDAVAEARAELERERAAFSKEQEEWRPKVERFQKLVERAKYDPVAVLVELGFEDGDFEPAARQLYAHSVEGRKDPSLREQSARTLRDRETTSRLEQIEAENKKLREEMQEREQRATEEQRIAAYMGRVEKAAGDDTPLVSRMLEKAPEKTRAQLRQVAEHLYEQTGEAADPADVVAKLEEVRRAEFEELGFDIPAAGKRAAPKKKNPAKASETAVAKTLSNDLGTETKPRTEPVSEDELRAQILRDMKELE